MKNESTNLIEDTLNSIDLINRAEASPFFSMKLAVKLNNSSSINEMPSKISLFIIATSLFLLLFMNTLILKQHIPKKQKEIDPSSYKESFSDLYDLNTHSTYYYDYKQK